MSWDNLPAFIKSTGRPMVSGLLRKGKDDQVKLILSLSAFVTEKWGDPETVNVQIGKDQHAGCVRIVADGTETHKLVKAVGGSRRLMLPWFEGLPKNSADTTTCPIMEQDGASVVIRLPVPEWEIAISRRTARPEAVSPVTPPPVKVSEGGGNKIDMVSALQAKGFKISRLTAGWYALDGDRTPALEVLGIFNKNRKKAGLTELTLEQVY